MKNFKDYLLIIAVVAVVVLLVYAEFSYITGVWDADLPVWLKLRLLMGGRT